MLYCGTGSADVYWCRVLQVAFVGFAVQALVTRTGPIEGLTAHLSSPFENNFTTSLSNLPAVIGQ
jgi:light-harvesting complex I chlorophyll a/b binding protein 5